MGDVGDYWREANEHKKKQKEKTRSLIPRAMAKLERNGIKFRSLDAYDEHIRVEELFDWWPTTGRWESLDGKHSGFRVNSLIRAIANTG